MQQYVAAGPAYLYIDTLPPYLISVIEELLQMLLFLGKERLGRLLWLIPLTSTPRASCK
jgi:hypothetical protein